MRAAVVLLVLSSMFAAPARAEIELCVNTVSELIGAFNEADNQDVVARLATNLYVLPSMPEPPSGDATFGNALSLIGGYNDDCSTRETLNPASTVIKLASGSSDMIKIKSDDDLHFESLTFTGASHGMYVYSYSALGTTNVDFWRVRISGLCEGRPSCESGGDALSIVGTDEIDFRQVLVDNNHGNGCSVWISAYALDFINVVNSTFVDNAGRGICIQDLSGGDSYEAYIYNNIFWNNVGTDIYTRDSEHITVSRNIAESTSFSPPPEFAPTNLINQDPLFPGSGSPQYLPLNASPAVNFGTISVPGGLPGKDIRGNTRLVGVRPDLGAYETTVDNVNNLVVTNTSDALVNGGPIPGSLRAAVESANNSSAADVIRFNIAGSCPRMITLQDELPDLIGQTVIDGYSQAGATENTTTLGTNANLCIGIRGNGAVTHAFRTPSTGPGSRISIRGIGFGGFTDAAVRFAGGSDHEIFGNQFGGSLDGNALNSNPVNIRLSGSSLRTQIGGPEAAQRNQISYATLVGIELLPGSPTDTRDNVIQNNLIGTTTSGNGAAPNLVGLSIKTGNNTIRDNLISGNSLNGLTIDGADANDNTITSNRIGLKGGITSVCFPPPCTSNNGLPNGLHGVTIIGGASDNRLTSNTIAYNNLDGVVVAAGRRNMLLSNKIYANDGISIDLDDDGADTNDNDAAPGSTTLPNRGLNWPVLYRATGGRNNGHDGHVIGRFTSTPGSYILQFFADTTCGNSSRGQGRYYIGGGFVNITVPVGVLTGHVDFDINVSNTSTNLVGKAISGIAIDADGDTSEFSTCQEFDDIIFIDGFQVME